jgi:hypothetical protein
MWDAPRPGLFIKRTAPRLDTTQRITSAMMLCATTSVGVLVSSMSTQRITSAMMLCAPISVVGTATSAGKLALCAGKSESATSARYYLTCKLRLFGLIIILFTGKA